MLVLYRGTDKLIAVIFELKVYSAVIIVISDAVSKILILSSYRYKYH